MPSSPSAASSDAALFGQDPLPRIVDVQPLLHGEHADRAAVRVYRRSEDGQRVTSEVEPFYPFFFLSDVELLRGFDRDRFRFQQLSGDNFYRHVVVFRSWGAYWDGVRHVEQTSNSGEQQPVELYRIGSPVQQYLTQTGRTCFKGMHFDEVHRLQLDIEVYSPRGFPNAARAEDEVIIVALHDNRGWHRILHARDRSEPELLRELVEVLQERDPDVIEGHNVFLFDFDYLRQRYERYSIPFAIGRDGSEPRAFPSSMRFAERSIDFTALEIAGRHVVDTFFQVMAFDVFKRDLPGYGLKEAARYFGFAPEGRTYVEGSEIARVWEEDPDRLIDYALDDVIETERLARHLSGSTFYLTPMLPMTYGQVARTGPAAKIEALFVREYLRQKHAFPKSEWGSQAMGGYTDIFLTGVVGPVVYADVESLYPSIMLNYDIEPEGDDLHLFPSLLQRLTDLRFEAKREMREAEGEVRSELDARQSSYKVLINSFYGSLGFSLSVFNDFSEADRVASTGQQILRQIIDLIRELGGRVIEVDTDGVLFVPPEGVRGEQDERAFLDRLNEEMPEGIRIGFDGRFAKMLSYKKKNYALLTYNGQLKFKGSSLISRSNERFGRRFVRRAIGQLLEQDVEAVHELYLRTRERIESHRWEHSVDSFSRTETLKDNPEQYLADVEAGRRPRAASYELAIARGRERRKAPRKGDRISYYITGTSANVTAFENSRLADEWDPEAPDENTAYYIKRLDEFARKFEPFFSDHDFRLVFSPEDLFGFSAEGIELVTHEYAVEENEEEVPF